MNEDEGWEQESRALLPANSRPYGGILKGKITPPMVLASLGGGLHSQSWPNGQMRYDSTFKSPKLLS